MVVGSEVNELNLILPRPALDLDGAIVSKDSGKVLRAFPILEKHPNQRERIEWFRFLNLVCFGSFVSNSNRPSKVISHEVILNAIGLESSTSSSTFKSGPFIERFTENVVPGFLVSTYDPHGKAKIIDDGLNLVRTHIENELLNVSRRPRLGEGLPGHR